MQPLFYIVFGYHVLWRYRRKPRFSYFMWGNSTQPVKAQKLGWYNSSYNSLLELLTSVLKAAVTVH